MPGAYRYSATFDKPYVEEASPPPRSPVRFSIGSWRGSNAPSSDGNEDGVSDVVVAQQQQEEEEDEEEQRVPLLRASDYPKSAASSPREVVVVEREGSQNPPLNGSYRDNARSASTDSLDSASCVSGSSAASSTSGGSGGHSRQVSMEGSEFISSRLSTGKMPVAAASHNPLQFVKVGPVPLYKKAEEQIKIAKEKKISRESIKENEEAWQSNLDSWKNRRRKMSEKSLQRLEELKRIEEQEKNEKLNNAKFKTFSEMMEERAQKPRSYNLAIYVNNSEEDLISPQNGRRSSSSDRPNDNKSRADSRSTSVSVDSENNESDFLNSSFRELDDQSNGNERKITASNSRNILSSESNQRQRQKLDYPEGGSGGGASVDDGFAEEEVPVFGVYTGDSGLESFGSSHRVGDLADSSSELSTDSGSVYDRPGTEDDNHVATPLGQLTTGTDLLEEFSTVKRTKSWPSSLEQKEGHIQRSMRINVNPQSKEKDFGFTIKVEKTEDGGSTPTVETIKAGSLSDQAGLYEGDEILAVNGEQAPGRSHSSLMFLVKQSVYRGHLDLVISRPEKYENDEEFDRNRSRPRSHVGPSQRRLLNNRSFDDSWQYRSASENGHRARSKSEASRFKSSWSEREKSTSLDERFPVMNEIDSYKSDNKSETGPQEQYQPPKPAIKKIPPPIPAKPKFSGGWPKRMAPQPQPKPISYEEPVESLIKPTESKQVESICSVGDLDNCASNYNAEKSNILDDMVQSENEDNAFHSVTPLLRTLSNGLRDNTDSPQFILKQDSDVCFSDFNESEQDLEKDSESSPKEDDWEQQRDEIKQQQLMEKRNSNVSVVEEEIIKVNVEPEDDFNQNSRGGFSLTNDDSCIPLNPLYQDRDGFNIIYQSHHDDSSKLSYAISEPSSSNSQFASPEPTSQKNIMEHRDSDEQLEEIHEDIVRVRVDVENQVYFENVNSEESHSRTNLHSEESLHSLSKSDGKPEPESFSIDEHILADLDDLPTHSQLPPSEKPPPPPPIDGDSPERSEGGEVVRRNNTFKRIKKEIWRRRSDFLGIDPADDEVNIDVPPPPDISEILKSERELERQSKIFLEKERMNSHYNARNNEDSPEREIILDVDIKHKRSFLPDQGAIYDQELVSTESTKLSLKMDDEERIKRLQDERRRMSEERILREEERISMEEERMFREREEKLRIKEGHDRVSSSSTTDRSKLESNLIGVETNLNNQQCVLKKSPQTSPNSYQPRMENAKDVVTSGLSDTITQDAYSSPPVDIAVKKALQLERERLRLEQEALEREREEYRRQMEMEQKRYSSSSSSEKSMSPHREAAIWGSKQPQGIDGDRSDIDFEDVVLRRKSISHDDIERQDISPSHQPPNKDTLHFLGAAPKAKIIQNEQWINHNEKQIAKRRSEPAMQRESRYNQNHWLLHEAEMRRISEQNERQRLQQSPDRRNSTTNLVPQYKSSETNGALPSTRRELLSRLPSTAPRPYQRPAAPPVPPPKPTRVNSYEKEQWNHQSVQPSGINSVPVKKEKVMTQLPPPLGDFRNYHTGCLPNQRIPPTENNSPMQEEQFLSVSGKERCSHCGEFLGHGGAMIIESLQLCYHMHCFCCCVCGTQLGNGMCGTDVRVRSNKLHCQNCYSNDEAGLKFSQV